MAAFGTQLAEWGPIIVTNLPHIIEGGVKLYNAFRDVKSSNNEKEAVNEAMELIKKHQGDIDWLMEDRKQMMAMLQGLCVMMERLAQHCGSPGIHHFHPPHRKCSQDAASPCCHHDHGPRDVPGCHHYGTRERCASHHHGPRGPSDFHHRGQREPPHRGSCYRNRKEHSGCSCSSHPEIPQWQKCSRHAASPCCHHDHGPRDVPECHHYRAKERCASHHHDPRGPSDFHHRGQREPPRRDSCYRNRKDHSGCSCSSHPEFSQWEGSSDDEDYWAASSKTPSSWRVCDVCYTSYNMSNRQPTILMCGHTFCRACLEEVARRGPLRCPTCRAYERRPTAALPSNVVLKVALEEESPLRQSGAKSGRDNDNGKKSSDMLQKEMLRQLAIHRLPLKSE